MQSTKIYYKILSFLPKIPSRIYYCFFLFIIFFSLFFFEDHCHVVGFISLYLIFVSFKNR